MDLKKLVKRLSTQNVNISMAKKSIHPEWYITKIFCDSKLVLEVGSTKKELHVDIWSGNHPFYTGSKKIIDAEGRVDKFEKKYGLNNVNTILENK
jgi:large subunit ribosomal protein L31